MWQLLPAKVLYGYFAILAVSSFLCVYWWQRRRRTLFPDPSSARARRALAALPMTITLVTLVTVLVGKFSWGLVAGWPFVEEMVYPDIRGTWRGTVKSIWRDVPSSSQVPFADTIQHGKEITVVARIHQDWFSFKVDLETGNNYSRSATMAVWPEVQESVNRRYRLWYVYLNETPEPVDGDAIAHYGAAVVEFSRDQSVGVLAGHYWTDRNWTTGKNTAGRIRLEHVSTDASRDTRW